MNKPKSRGAAISADRLGEWLSRFRFYRDPPDRVALDAWLRRFSKDHRDLAARILDCVEVISEKKIQQGYRQALSRMPGWHTAPTQRVGRWVFVGFGGAGESGQSMLRLFREANNLTAAIHDSLFCGITDLPSLQLTAKDNVVFVDDFSGTGRQVCTGWPTLKELIASEAACYLILTAATSAAVSRIEDETDLQLIVSLTLKPEDNVFHQECKTFSREEKLALERYGKKADRKNPKGWGGCGLLFVLSHKTPNNTLPILHAHHDRWLGLFPRYLHAAG